MRSAPRSSPVFIKWGEDEFNPDFPRDGDRFWYQRYLLRFWVRVVERRTLATIIRQNTLIGRELQDNVLRVD